MLLDYAKKNPYFDSRSTYDLADIFGVSAQTISNWIRKYPAFRNAVDDVQKIELKRVVSSLIKRTLGHFTVEEKTIISPDGSVTIQKTKKEVLPDSALIRYYLNNRDPDHWTEKREEEKQMRNVVINVANDPDEVA